MNVATATPQPSVPTPPAVAQNDANEQESNEVIVAPADSVGGETSTTSPTDIEFLLTPMTVPDVAQGIGEKDGEMGNPDDVDDREPSTNTTLATGVSGLSVNPDLMGCVGAALAAAAAPFPAKQPAIRRPVNHDEDKYEKGYDSDGEMPYIHDY